MRKKTILSIGALTLACGLGIAAMGGANLLPLTLSAGVSTMADTPSYLVFLGVSPADNSVIPVWNAPASLTVSYTDASPGTFPGCMINKALTTPVVVSKVADNGELTTVKTISASEVSVSAKNPCDCIIPLSGVEWEAGKYQVDIPEGLILKDTDDPGSLNPDDGATGVITAAHNQARTVTYQIMDVPTYTTVPANGGIANLAADGLNKVTVAWDADKVSKVELADASNLPVINLYLVDQAASSEETGVGVGRKVMGTYAPVCSGDKLELNLTLAEGVESLEALTAGVKYYELAVPAGLVNLYGSDGASLGSNLAINLSNLSLQFQFDASLVKVVEPETNEFTPSTFPKEVILQFPGEIEIAQTIASYYTPTLYRTTATGKSNVGSYNIEVAPNKKTVILTLKDATALSITNNPDVWFDGEYYLQWGASKDPFKDVATGNLMGKNLRIDLGTMKDGYTQVVPWEEFINAAVGGSVYMPDGDDNTTKEVNVPSSDFGNVACDPGVGSLSMKFPYPVIPVNDETKKIALYRVGETAPLWEQTAGAKLNEGHLWSSAQPNSTTKATTTASQTVHVIYNLTDETFKRGTSATLLRVREYLKTPGTYRLVADEGFFYVKNANYPEIPSGKIEIEFTISGKDIEYTLNPAFGTDLEEVSEFTFTYPEGAVVSVKEGAQATMIGNPTLLGGPNYNIPYTLDIKGEGNVVTVYAPVPVGIPYKNGYEVSIPSGSWTVTYNGETQSNRLIEGAYKLTNLTAGPIVPATDASVTGADLNSIVYTSKAPIKDAGATKAQLLDAEGNAVATYTFTNAPVSEDGDKPVTECFLQAGTDLSDLAEGEYKLVIYTTTFSYSNSVVQNNDFTFVYNVKANPADNFTLFQPASAEVTYTGNNGAGMNMIGWEFSDAAITLNSECASPVELKFNNETIATLPASSVIFDAPMAWGEITLPGAVSLSFPETPGVDYTLTGEYAVVVPEGLFLKDGQPLGAFAKTYTYTNDKPVVDFTYTLNPESGKTTDSLEEIVLTFTNATYLNYAGDSNSSTNPVAVLENEDGSVVLNCGFPKVDGNSLVFSFGGTMTEWKNGKYTLTVRPGMVCVDDITWDEYSGTPANFEGLTAEYTLEGAVQLGSLRDHVTYSVPSSLEANPVNTKTPFGETAMGIIALGVDTDKITGVPNCDFLLLSYSPTENGEYTVLSAINPNNDLEVNVIGIALTGDDDGLIEFPTSQTLFMLFANDGDGSVDMSRISEFSKTGYYKLTIPDGSFAVDGAPVKGFELVYHYDADGGQQSFKYELSPAEGYTFTSYEDLMIKGSGITVTFPDASQVDFVTPTTGSAVLVCPDGTELKNNYPQMSGKGVTYTFGNADSNWQNGAYTFKLAAKKIGINMGYLDYGDEGNNEAIEAVYHLADGTLGVALIGVGAADSYNVYTLDGKVVKANAAIEDLKELEPGLYIINGKKAYLRK